MAPASTQIGFNEKDRHRRHTTGGAAGRFASSGRALAVGVTIAVLLAAPGSRADSATTIAPPIVARPEPAPAPSGDTNLAANTRSALKLAGLVTFVANSCPALKPDYDRFKAALSTLGLSFADLSKNDLKVIYIGYAARYAEDAKANCEHARLAFGPKGATIPEIFASR